MSGAPDRGGPTLAVPDAARLGRAEDFLPGLAVLDPSLAVIRETVCLYFEVTEDGLLGHRRHPRLVIARQVGYWLACRLAGRSLAAVSRAFARDHSTVASGLRRIDDLRRRQPGMRDMLDHLAAELRGGGEES